MASPIETELGNHGRVVSTLVHDMQSAPVPTGDKSLGQAISQAIPAVQHDGPVPDGDFGLLVSGLAHEGPIPDGDFGLVVSGLAHQLHLPPSDFLL